MLQLVVIVVYPIYLLMSVMFVKCLDLTTYERHVH